MHVDQLIAENRRLRGHLESILEALKPDKVDEPGDIITLTLAREEVMHIHGVLVGCIAKAEDMGHTPENDPLMAGWISIGQHIREAGEAQGIEYWWEEDAPDAG